MSTCWQAQTALPASMPGLFNTDMGALGQMLSHVQIREHYAYQPGHGQIFSIPATARSCGTARAFLCRHCGIDLVLGGRHDPGFFCHIGQCQADHTT
eukprot:scaffold174798_cov21-Tisochrysis_lutea.AAC.4